MKHSLLDFHGDTYAYLFQNKITRQLIPNIPSNGVIVIVIQYRYIFIEIDSKFIVKYYVCDLFIHLTASQYISEYQYKRNYTKLYKIKT